MNLEDDNVRAARLLALLQDDRTPQKDKEEIRAWFRSRVSFAHKDAAWAEQFRHLKPNPDPDREDYEKYAQIAALLDFGDSQAKVAPIRRKRSLLRISMRVAAVLLLFLGIAEVFNLWIDEATDTTEPTITAEVIVAAGGNRQTVLLPDGSTVTLYPGSELTHPADFTDDRHVALTGKAFFQVARDEQRQFSVAADGLIVTVHGTEFMVTAFDGAENAKVMLHSGSVEVAAGEQRSMLSPGQQLEYFNKLNEVVISQVEPEDWTKPNLDFNMRPLGEILTSLEVYYGTAIEMNGRDSTCYTIDLTGSGDAESALRLLLGVARDFTYEKEQDTIKIRTKLK